MVSSIGVRLSATIGLTNSLIEGQLIGVWFPGGDPLRLSPKIGDVLEEVF